MRMTKLNQVATDFVERRTRSAASANSSGSLHNRGETAFSYNAEIARHDGEGRILMSKRRYSVTTSKHQSAIRHAASLAGVPVVETEG